MNAASGRAPEPLSRRILRTLNLRPEEVERTILMFLFNATVFVGGVWLEGISDSLVLSEFSVETLTWAYMAIAVVVSILGVFYSWLQRILPLRMVMVGMGFLVALPVFGFWIGLGMKGTFLYGASIFGARLWVDAVYTISYINSDIAANQLFNIREVKRAFPIVGTGITVAEIISGFSLPILAKLIGLRNVTLVAFGMLLFSTILLFYISQRYRQAFPNSAYTEAEDGELSTTRMQGNLKSYVTMLFGFFIVSQLVFFVIAYQFFGQLEVNLKSAEAIATFVGNFGGFLGILKLMVQLFGTSRVTEKIGLFFTVLIPPALTVILGILAGIAPFGLLIGFVVLRGFDDLFRYTIVASTSPVLFQAVPDQFRSRIQSFVRGVADPMSTGLAGAAIFGITELLKYQHVDLVTSARIFAGITVLLALVWIGIIFLLRRGYLNLLIQSVERGQLSLTDVDVKEVRRAVAESLIKSKNEADQFVYIELLTQVAPKTVAESLAPLLLQMTPELQKQSLEAMLLNPEERYLPLIKDLLQSPSASPQVRSLSLRYNLLADPNPDIASLRKFLGPEQNPLIRSTAVALMMRLGTPAQVAEATNTLRQMITSPHQPERVLGCQALAEASYMQSLRFYVPTLLQDPSIEVRCALLKAIAATREEDYFPSVIRGLYYKATRQAAYEALVNLGDDALDSLLKLGQDERQIESVRLRAWEIMGDIATPAAVNLLAIHLRTSWGKKRRAILRTLIRVPLEAGIETTLEMIGRSGVETMVNQELTVKAEAWAAIQDLPKDQIGTIEADLIRDSLQLEIEDSLERLFLLMKLLYTPSAIQAASFNILSGSRGNMARGIEILDNTIDLSNKQIILAIVDKRLIPEKLRILSDIHPYQPMSGVKRLRRLIEIRHCLSDWTLACCFHVGRVQWWGIPAADTVACLQHPTSFVREAVIAYLQVASPRSLQKFLPKLKEDRDPLVGAQARAIAAYFRTTSFGRNDAN
jgi:HEAT repeat protein/ATP/ADP translocase